MIAADLLQRQSATTCRSSGWRYHSRADEDSEPIGPCGALRRSARCRTTPIKLPS